MNTERTHSSIHERVQARIRSGDLARPSRLVSALQIASVFLTAFLALVATLVALSFVLYSVYESGEAFLLGFGTEGLALFFLLFPWGTATVALLSLALFQWRLSYVVPSYRLPVLPLFLVLVLGTTAIGYALVPVHGVIGDRIEDTGLPLVSELYESVYQSREGYGIYRGLVREATDEGIWMSRTDGDADEDDALRFVTVSGAGERFPPGYEVFVVGEQDGATITASHIVAIPE